MRISGILLVSKKEYMDNVRNRWVIVLSLLFAVISLVIAYVSGAQATGAVGFTPFDETVPALNPVMLILIPLVALILGYATIAGEDENGSLGLLLSLTVTRNEVILGKFLGLGAILLSTVAAGLGITGVVVGSIAGAEEWPGYLAFMGIALLLGLAYLSLAVLLSTATKRRAAALGGAVLIFFFFNFIYDLLVFGILVATGWQFDLLNLSVDFPDWVWWALIVNPSEGAHVAAFMAFGVEQIFGIPYSLPGFVSAPLVLGILATWTLIPLTLSFLLFNRRDL